MGAGHRRTHSNLWNLSQVIEPHTKKKTTTLTIKRIIFTLTGISFLGIVGLLTFTKINFNSDYAIGEPIDSLNHVIVYYNGGVGNVVERNLAEDGYNLGLKYQCVEFVKRYYYEHLNHKMPDSYGHAKDFFDISLSDGQMNAKRDLIQFSNSSDSIPKINDLVVFSGTILNRYGHVAIISNVTNNKIEIIQQNPGPFGISREEIDLVNENGKWKIENEDILGWLRENGTDK